MAANPQWSTCITLDSLVADIEVEQDNIDIQKEEEERINVQMQHKIRQRMLLMSLDQLRAKDNKRKIAQPPQSTININGEHGWLSPLLTNLDRAHRYVKSRAQKTEQWSKLFPSASQSFESRCSELRQDLLRLELNIDRFKNILTKQLDSTEMKMKSFVADFHLESFTQGISDEDEETRESNPVDVDYENETAIDCRDMEPVREIRDINDDSPIPVDDITGDINFEDEDVCPASPIPTIKPTVTIKQVKMSRSKQKSR
ncbi:uncharacterized protein LOC128398011 [Panonychus citri]|uniref:uncharacterized protein LOC128398011 n=1 Tax=Panonychus citri TaxID=50023 RepID=UPI002307D5B9|nr:uncharacterized protein LOC128398011 [Panonychus citri]